MTTGLVVQVPLFVNI
ncbi:MAG: hypothetical protein LBU14_01770 [Candidatus Peribacteria bacterium]|nr:hypothetical protein [Candidatus Peribacteria bacterium]